MVSRSGSEPSILSPARLVLQPMAPTTQAPTTVINVAPPPPLDIDSADLHEDWKNFRSDFKIYATVTRLKEQGEEIVKATFLSCIGVPARRWLRGLGVDVETLSAAEIEKEIEAKCSKKSTKTLLDYKFWGGSLMQHESEMFDSYLGRIRSAATACKFMDVSDGVSIVDRLIRSQLIIGLQDKDLQRELLTKDLNLDSIIEKCQSYESSKRSQAVMVKTESDRNVIAAFRPHRAGKAKVMGESEFQYGRSHGFAQGNFRGDIRCFRCGKIGHFKNECHSRQQGDMRRLSMIQATGDESSDQDSADEFQGSEVYAINAIRRIGEHKRSMSQPKAKSKWHERVEIGGNRVMVMLDTGAECSTLPRTMAEQLIKKNPSAKRMPTKTKLVSFFGNEYPAGDSVTLSLAYRKKRRLEKFYMVQDGLAPTISGDAAEALGLIRRIEAVQEARGKKQWIQSYPDVLRGVGEINGAKVKRRLKDEFQEHIRACRRTPMAYETPVKQELERMSGKEPPVLGDISKRP